MDEENLAIVKSWNHLMDVPVKLSIELGRTKMKLQEVLDLKEESIVKLSRSTGEGVDVCADKHSLANGEIVVVDDRARVRLNELVSDEN